MDITTQHKTKYTETEEKLGNSLELIDTGEKFLNRTPIAQALSSALINETS